jgi:ribonuclease BN (tRNA processing enzyme)
LRGITTEESLLAEAKKTFTGKVVLAKDLMEVGFNRT